MAADEIIYFDNNATTPLDPAVIEEMLPFLTKYYGNPSSGYAFAARARKAVDLARERLAALLGCAPSEIVFTSGGTESNNAVIHSALQFAPQNGNAAFADKLELSFFSINDQSKPLDGLLLENGQAVAPASRQLRRSHTSCRSAGPLPPAASTAHLDNSKPRIDGHETWVELIPCRSRGVRY